MDIHNPQGSFMQTGGANVNNALQGEMTSSLQSFRDSLAFSFQSLNLTLASLNSTIQSAAARSTLLGIPAPSTTIPNNSYLQMAGPAGSNMMSALSPQSIGPLWNLASSVPRYNMNPLQFWPAQNQETAARVTNAVLSTGGSIANGLLGAVGLGTSFLGLGAGTVGRIGVSALQYATDMMVKQGQEHLASTANLQRIAPHAGAYLNAQQAGRLDSSLVQAGYEDMMYTSPLSPKLGTAGFRNIALMGMQTGMIKGSDVASLSEQVKTAGAAVKLITQILGSEDIQSAIQAMQQMYNKGLNPVTQIGAMRNMLNEAARFGNQMGTSAGQVLNFGLQYGSAAAGGAGLAGITGVRPAMENLAYTEELRRRGVLSPLQLASGGGAQAIAGNMTQAMAGMVADPTGGQLYVMAGMNHGQFDLTLANNAGKGNYFDLLSSASSNYFGGGLSSMYAWEANRQTLTNNALTNSETGGLSKMATDSLLREMEFVPGWSRASTSTKMNMLIVTLEQKGMSESAAHAYATKVLFPDLSQNKMANANYNNKLIQQVMIQNSPYGTLQDVRNIPTKAQEWGKYTVGGIGRDIADTVYSGLSTDYTESALATGHYGTYTSNVSRDAFLTARDSGAYTPLSKSDIRENILAEAGRLDINEGNPNTNPYSVISRGSNKYEGYVAGDYNVYAPNNGRYSKTWVDTWHDYVRGKRSQGLTDANAAYSYHDMWDYLAGNKQATDPLRNLAAISEFTGTNVDASRVKDIYKSVASWSSGSPTPTETIIGSSMALYNLPGSKGMDIARANYEQNINKYNPDKVLQDLGMAIDDFKGLSNNPDAARNMLLNNGVFKKLYGKDAPSVASTMGFYVTGGMNGVNQATTQNGLSLNDLGGELGHRAAGGMMQLGGSILKGNAAYYAQLGNNPWSVNTTQGEKLLKSFGLTGDYFTHNVVKPEYMDTLAKAATQLVTQGSDGADYGSIAKTLEGISDSNFKGTVSAAFGNTDSLNKDSLIEFLPAQIKAKLKAGMTLTKEESQLTYSSFRSELGNGALGVLNQLDVNSLERLGGKVSPTLRNKLNGAKGDEYLTIVEKALNNGELGNTSLTNNLRSDFANIDSMGLDELSMQDYTGTGKDLATLYREKTGKAPTDLTDMRKFAKLEALSGSENMQAYKESDAATKYNSKVDTLVHGSGEDTYINVIVKSKDSAGKLQDMRFNATKGDPPETKQVKTGVSGGSNDAFGSPSIYPDDNSGGGR